ncbi:MULTISPECIES: NTP/NDP exchange transporter [Mycetohabitans]|uniref:MFS transporter n=1 Tax=Mycetohabitans rhizoxinica TaxID=412963 RepID=A0ABZ2PWS2_9BURK|nr:MULTISPECIES: MFS transporter [Mycetohabitans]MCF7696941.1 MFS transporter [Mycetohabitans sp. B2]MCG1048477.1 MFS transporter [Mycetohabitans sp. B6]
MRRNYFKLMSMINASRKQWGMQFKLRPGEGRPLLWSALGLFWLSLAYYLIRPIRDTMGAVSGVQKLTWLFSATLLCMLLISFLFSKLLNRISLRRAVSISYRVCIAILIMFAILMRSNAPEQAFWIGDVFFVWVSAYSVFSMTMYWMMTIDKFSKEQGERLFGIVSAGANLGALAGSGMSTALSGLLGLGWTLAIAAILLELAARSTLQLTSTSTELDKKHRRIAYQGKRTHAGSMTSGVQQKGNINLNGLAKLFHITPALRASHVASLCVYVVLLSLTSTALYFHQAILIQGLDIDNKERIRLFSLIDLAVNAVTIVIQLFLTSRVIRSLGVPIALAMAPVTSAIGFSMLAWKQTVEILIAFRVISRIVNFSITKPVQETLFAAIDEKIRYKIKSFIDTVAYRSGDQLGAWTYAGMGMLGLSISAISFAMVPLSIFWLLNGVRLGRQYARLAAAQSDPDSSS